MGGTVLVPARPELINNGDPLEDFDFMVLKGALKQASVSGKVGRTVTGPIFLEILTFE
jgi:hypothetical protein